LTLSLQFAVYGALAVPGSLDASISLASSRIVGNHFIAAIAAVMGGDVSFEVSLANSVVSNNTVSRPGCCDNINKLLGRCLICEHCVQTILWPKSPGMVLLWNPFLQVAGAGAVAASGAAQALINGVGGAADGNLVSAVGVLVTGGVATASAALDLTAQGNLVYGLPVPLVDLNVVRSITQTVLNAGGR
jgi:hypothetical protein